MLAQCVVPSSEVLELTEELQRLGGGDVAIGCAWTGAVGDGDPEAAASGGSRGTTLDAACSNLAELSDALLQEVWPWLQQGFSATALLLAGSMAEGAGQPSAAATIASRVGAAALASGCQLGLSWELVSGSEVTDHAGRQQQMPGISGKRQAAASAPSGLRPGSGAAAGRSAAASSAAASSAAASSGQPACGVIHAGCPAELQQLLAAAQRQLREAAAAIEGQQHAQPPTLILHLALQPSGSQAAAQLHIAQLGFGGGTLSRSSQAELRQPQQMWLQPPAQQVLPLLQEVADLHQRRREGTHVLAASKLTPLAHRFALLLAGGTRLFVAADAISSDGSRNAGCWEGWQKLPSLLTSLRHVQAVCTRSTAGAAAGASTAGSTSAGAATPAHWMPCQEFLQRAEQRQAAGRRQTAQAATLAAPEAERQQRLRQAAVQKQQQLAAGGKATSTAVPAAPAQAQQQQQQQREAPEQGKSEQQAVHEYQPSAYGSPDKAGQTAGAAAGAPAAAVAAETAAAPPPAAAAAAPAALAAATAVAEPAATVAAPMAAPAAAVAVEKSQRQQATASLRERVPGLASKEPGTSLPAADCPPSEQSASLQQLRQQFQSLYRQTVGGAASSLPTELEGAAAAATSLPPMLPPPLPQQQRQQQQQQHAIAAGVAAADNVSLHVAAQRMRAASEAQQAQQAQQELLQECAHNSRPAPATCGSPACSTSGGSSSTGSPRCSSSTHSSCGRLASSAGLGQQLEHELLLLQQQAASKAAGSMPASSAHSPCCGGSGKLSEQAEHDGACAELEAAELASLDNLDPAASFTAFFRHAPPTRLPTGSASIRHSRASATAPCAEEQQQAAQHWWQQEHWQCSVRQAAADGMAALPAAAAAAQPAGLPVADAPLDRPLGFPPSLPPASPTVAGQALPAAAESDAFDSVNLHRWLSPQRRAAVASVLGADEAADSPTVQSGLLQPPAARYSHRHARSSSTGDSHGGEDGRSGSGGGVGLHHSSSFPDLPSRQMQGTAGQEVPRGSYAAAWQRQGHASHHAGPVGGDGNDIPAGSRQQGLLPPSALLPTPCGARRGRATAPEAAAEHALAAVDASTDSEAAVLQELECERRLNATLLHQLHQLQQEVQEVAAAAVAASAPPPDQGVETPEDFNALLAALQLERRQHGALRQQMLVQEQQAEEQLISLETQLLSLHRQLLVTTARCRAWEQQSPLAPLFGRYEEDLQRVEARCEQLQEENAQLAAIVAEADLQRLTGSAERLPEGPAAVCREHQRKLQQAQAQNRKLLQERAALQKQLQGAQRRDRLADLCRRQAETGAKTLAELRRQLEARDRQLEAQALAAAEAAAEAAHLQNRLQGSERELGQALADRADLEDMVDSLRKQVGVLRGQLSKDRILKSMQFPAP